MIIEPTKIDGFVVTNVPGLDPVMVLLHDKAPGKGNIIITCFGQAWTAWWGAMGDDTVESFVRSAPADYVMDALLNGTEPMLKSRAKHAETYLLRIVNVVQEAMRMRKQHDEDIAAGGEA